MECGYITDRQIEASRVAMTRFIKRGGKIWLRLFPDKPITKKPAETRMGKGKGAPDHWVAVVRPGKMLFEMEGVAPDDGAGSDAAGGAQAAAEDPIRDASRCNGHGGGEVTTKLRRLHSAARADDEGLPVKSSSEDEIEMEMEKIRNLSDDELKHQEQRPPSSSSVCASR